VALLLQDRVPRRSVIFFSIEVSLSFFLTMLLPP
jgi:hypothetical protein